MAPRTKNVMTESGEMPGPMSHEEPSTEPAVRVQEAPAPELIRVVPEVNQRQADKRALAVLLSTCKLFGINPRGDLQPRELAKWEYLPARTDLLIPDGVKIVTKGGLKLVWFSDDEYPVDEGTFDRLIMWFRLRPDSAGNITLPDDLTLPREAVDGIVRKMDHVYKGGYLKSGGKTEAERRASARTRKAR